MSILWASLPYSAFGQSDWRYWNELRFVRIISPQFSYHVKSEQRWIANSRDLGLHNYASGILLRSNDYWSIEANVKHELDRNESGWKPEWRLEFIAKAASGYKGFTFGVNTRMEYRRFKDLTKWRWREKLLLRRKVVAFGCQCNAFLANEFFYDFMEKNLVQNRADIGMTVPVRGAFAIAFFYRLKSNLRSDRWLHSHVVGTKFSFSP